MKILILGGTGAMGIHLAEMLKFKHEVFITSRKKCEDAAERLHFLQGNAKNIEFLNEVVSSRWDVIIDFMVYTTDEFENRFNFLLNSTDHYFFLSSARVFSDSRDKITENTERLLDDTEDFEYLKTDEYAISKARQENFLATSEFKNWTIIRPYITYSENRLQLGVLEKEEWLYRALKGRAIVFCSDLLNKKTTLTYGLNVAQAIASLIGKEEAKKNCFNITNNTYMTWKEVLDIYVDILKKETGKKPKVILLSINDFLKCKPAKYQIIYDRLFDRTFDNSKIEAIGGELDWKDTKKGLEDCLRYLIKNPDFQNINWGLEVIKDKYSKQFTSIFEINGFKNKIRYLLKRI